MTQLCEELSSSDRCRSLWPHWRAAMEFGELIIVEKADLHETEGSIHRKNTCTSYRSCRAVCSWFDRIQWCSFPKHLVQDQACDAFQYDDRLLHSQKLPSKMMMKMVKNPAKKGTKRLDWGQNGYIGAKVIDWRQGRVDCTGHLNIVDFHETLLMPCHLASHQLDIRHGLVKHSQGIKIQLS